MKILGAVYTGMVKAGKLAFSPFQAMFSNPIEEKLLHLSHNNNINFKFL